MKLFGLFFSFLFLCSNLLGDAAECTVHFSCEGDLADKLIELIDKEKKSLKIAVYSINHIRLGKAISRAKKRGVDVEVVIDPFCVKKKSPIHDWIEKKVPLYVWDRSLQMGREFASPKQKSQMHHAFCIFGDRLVWTGSFLFTYDSSKRNQENVICLDSKKVAQKYLSHFSHLKLYESRPLSEYIALYPKKRGKKVR